MQVDLPEQRRRRVLHECGRAGIHALLIYGNAWTCDFLRYACGFVPLEGHGAAVLTADGTRLVLEQRGEADRARAEVPGLQVDWAPDFHEAVGRALADARARAPAGLGHAPAANLPGAIARALHGSADATPALQRLLMAKLDAEIDAVRRAAALADEGYEVFLRAAREGRTEYEVVGELEAFFRRRGCPDNFMIMASGGQEVRAMHPPGRRRLQRGDFVTTELTPCVDGYYAQICRTLVLGPPSPQQQKAFDVHLEALEAGMACVRPGVTAGAVATAQNDVFRAHGLGPYITTEYTRVRGHGLGLYVDSRPAIQEGDPTVLEAGMTMIVHPNGYHPDTGYLVLGDALVLREDGPDVLTRTPRRLFVV